MVMKMKIKLEEFKRYDTGKGTVIIYRSGGLYVITYDDATNERVWGIAESPRKALHIAEAEWKRLIGGDNPFTVALQMREAQSRHA